MQCTFQLTRPVWGEPCDEVEDDSSWDISTHSPRVGRTSRHAAESLLQFISTHSPRVGRTCFARPYFSARLSFQLTRPVWGEPNIEAVAVWYTPISTHSPRVGRTYRAIGETDTAVDFNSLAPCGANHCPSCRRSKTSRFQLTRPVWGEP